MPNPTARPEAQEELYLIWNRNRREWIHETVGYTDLALHAKRFSHREAAKITDEFRLVAVPLSDALRDGPPVEAPEVHAYCMSPDEWDAANAAVEAPAAPGSQSIGERLRRACLWHDEVWREVERIIRGNRPFASAHEGLAIFEEEAEELQGEVRHGTLAGIVEEATQAAAVAVRILTDCGGEPPNGEDGDE